MVGRIVVKEGHRLGSQVGVIDCQIHKNEKMKVNCIITDPNSDLDIAVVLLVFTGTYSFSSKDSEQLTKGTVVIMSLDEFKRKDFFSASQNSQVGIMYYFDPRMAIEKRILECHNIPQNPPEHWTWDFAHSLTSFPG